MYPSPEPLPAFALKRQAHQLEPRRLAMLLDMYEHNYAQLQQLLAIKPTATTTADTATSTRQAQRLASSHDAELPHLFVEHVDATPYTHAVLLTYRFPDKVDDLWQTFDEPSVLVRLFHDAKVAEVLTVGEHKHTVLIEAYKHDNQRYSKRRWQMNRLLNKWLDYLLNNQYQ